MNWYLEAMKNYAVFSGRARRKEYWYFVLFSALIGIVIVMISMMILGPEHARKVHLVLNIYQLAILLPGLSVTVRRLHDTDRSGWWALIGIIPLLGALVLLAFALLDSNNYENRFGPSPKWEGA